MDYSHGCISDNHGNYINNVLINLIIDENGDTVESVHAYDLRDGERLVKINPPGNILRPKLNGNETGWIETATPEEIEAAKPPAQPITISESDRISALEEAILTLALGGALDV